MARQKLTAKRVRDFECPTEKFQVFLWDSEVPGLGLRATAGAKVYIFQSRLNGKTLRIKIGDTGAWVIDSNDPITPGARQEARRLQGLIDKGLDPRLEKKKQLNETEKAQDESVRQELTVAEAWNEYLETRQPKWSERHYQDHVELAKEGGQDAKRRKKGTKIKPGPLYSLMKLRLVDLTPKKIQEWAEKEAIDRGARTRLAFNLLRAFINWCNEQSKFTGLAKSDAVHTRIKREALPRQRPKNDTLQREQLWVWFKAVCELSNPVHSSYLQTLLLTGARRNEVATLQWSDIDFQWKSITIHDKVEGERTIPLTPYVESILSPLVRRNEWVFSSPTAKSGRLEEPRIPHNRALATVGIEGLTLHGLRRSFGTLSEWVECPAGIVAQLMGHKPSATAEKHYRRRPLDLLRMWHEKIEKWILEQAGIEQPKISEHGLNIVKTV